jgi:hypothetical protein
MQLEPLCVTNRGFAVVLPRTPFVEWINAADPFPANATITLDDTRDEQSHQRFPLLNTNRVPFSAARSETGLRPGYFLRRGFGDGSKRTRSGHERQVPNGHPTNQRQRPSNPVRPIEVICPDPRPCSDELHAEPCHKPCERRA